MFFKSNASRKNLASPELVILLHGLAMGPWHMYLLARRLAQAGFLVKRLGYPSTQRTIPQLAASLEPGVKQLALTAGTVHFVGHSLGGLIVKNLLERYRPKNLGRVVNLGTPYHGSEVADFFCKFSWFHKLYGPAAAALCTKTFREDPRAQPIDYELASIAGVKGRSPWACLLPKPNDGTVSAASTQIAGAKAYYQVASSHFGLPLSKKVSQLTARFLLTGDPLPLKGGRGLIDSVF